MREESVLIGMLLIHLEDLNLPRNQVVGKYFDLRFRLVVRQVLLHVCPRIRHQLTGYLTSILCGESANRQQESVEGGRE